jgi:hypothetical protein
VVDRLLKGPSVLVSVAIGNPCFHLVLQDHSVWFLLVLEGPPSAFASENSSKAGQGFTQPLPQPLSCPTCEGSRKFTWESLWIWGLLPFLLLAQS